MAELYNEEYFKYLEEWLLTQHDPSCTRKEFLEKKGVLGLIESAFSEAFTIGRKKRDQENWELWNQK